MRNLLNVVLHSQNAMRRMGGRMAIASAVLGVGGYALGVPAPAHPAAGGASPPAATTPTGTSSAATVEKTAPPTTAPDVVPSIFDDAPGTPGATTQSAIKLGPSTSEAPPVINPGETPQQSYERIYGPRVEKVSLTATKWDDIYLAQQILNDAMELPTPSPMQEYMLHKSYELGLRSYIGYQVSLACLENLERYYPNQKDECDERMLAIYEAAAQLPNCRIGVVANLYITKVDELADAKLRANDVEGAIALYQRSLRAERLISKSGAILREEAIRRLRERTAMQHHVEALRASLQKSPDPTTATTLVKLILLDWNDWRAMSDALPLVDDEMHRVADSVSTGIDKLTESQAKEVGDWYKANYRFATTGKVQALTFGRDAYQRALDQHPAHDVMWLELRSSLQDVAGELYKAQREAYMKAYKDQKRDFKEVAPRGSIGGGTKPPANPGSRN